MSVAHTKDLKSAGCIAVGCSDTYTLNELFDNGCILYGNSQCNELYMAATEQEVLDQLVDEGCCTADYFWIYNGNTTASQKCYETALPMAAVGTKNIDAMVYRFCNTYDWNISDQSIRYMCLDWASSSEARRSITENNIRYYCNPPQISAMESRYKKVPICACFNMYYFYDEIQFTADLCSPACNQLITNPYCGNFQCGSADANSYRFGRDVTCQSVQLCVVNIENSNITVGEMNIICQSVNIENEEEKQRLCRNADPSSLPSFCTECIKAPNSQECCRELGNECGNTVTGAPCPNKPTRCNSDDPNCNGTNPAKPPDYCYSYCSTERTDRDPVCGHWDPACKVQGASQQCYDDVNAPCKGPAASTYWQCASSLPSKCNVTKPDYECYALAGKQCEYPQPDQRPSQCSQQDHYCNITIPKPTQCKSIDEECHVQGAPQKCFNDMNKPCSLEAPSRDDYPQCEYVNVQCNGLSAQSKDTCVYYSECNTLQPDPKCIFEEQPKEPQISYTELILICILLVIYIVIVLTIKNPITMVICLIVTTLIAYVLYVGYQDSISSQETE